MFDWLINRKKLLSDTELLGEWGEKRALKFLVSRGYKALIRNFSCHGGEVDIIMVDLDGAIVFVEVKTRKDENFESAESAVNFGKRSKLIKAAKYFTYKNELHDRPMRFDVVTVVLPPAGKVVVQHFQNAFTP